MGQVPRLPYRGHQGWGPHTTSLQSDGPSEPRPSGRMGLHPTAQRWDPKPTSQRRPQRRGAQGPAQVAQGTAWPQTCGQQRCSPPFSTCLQAGLSVPSPTPGCRGQPRGRPPLVSAQGSPRPPLSKSAVATGRAPCCPEGPAGPE